MKEKERIIVSLTTWSKRITNIPVILDTIFAQTLPPDLVVLNLAYDEQIPEMVQDYINCHSIEVNRVPDTRVYKKLIPTLKKYPNDCIISIDDDWLYPKDMISDFMEMHTLYPNNPISGNRVVMFDMQCHCGCASLTKAKFINKYIEMIDEETIANCPSDDIVYTYFANKAGHPYMRTKNIYFTNLKAYNNLNSYSATNIANGEIEDSYNYLINRFGQLNNFIFNYNNDSIYSNIIYEIHKQCVNQAYLDGLRKGENRIYRTISYRLGNNITKPISYIKFFIGNILKKVI